MASLHKILIVFKFEYYKTNKSYLSYIERYAMYFTINNWKIKNYYYKYLVLKINEQTNKQYSTYLPIFIHLPSNNVITKKIKL